MKLDGEIWFRGGGAMKGDDSLGRDSGMIAGKFIWETLSLRTIVGRGEAMRIEA